MLHVAGLFVAGALIPRLNVGLDQAVALPNDSYLQQYYRYVMRIMFQEQTAVVKLPADCCFSWQEPSCAIGARCCLAPNGMWPCCVANTYMLTPLHFGWCFHTVPRDLYAYLRVGPPLYMVVGPISVKEASPDVNKLCSIAGCQPDSLAVRVSFQHILCKQFVALLLFLKVKLGRAQVVANVSTSYISHT